MAKHRRQSANTTTRRFVAATAAAAGLGLLVPGAATAAEVHVPNTDISFNVEGIENVPGIANIPGIENYIPELAGQGTDFTGAALNDIVEQVKNHPIVAQVPGLAEKIDSIAAEYGYTSGTVTPAATTTSGSAPAGSAAVSSAPSSTGQAVVDAARSKIGAPYAWGAAGPNSFDCSGLTSWAYAQAGKQIPRTSQAQAGGGQQVSLNDLQPGDIIAYYSGASHVGIYTGNGTIIDALNSGTPVQERPLDYMPIHSAVRF